MRTAKEGALEGKKVIGEKLREAAASVLPIALIVIILCFTLVPVGTDLMLSFIIGTVMVIVGMGLFQLGADMSMTAIGNHIGSRLTRSRKLWLILIVSFVLGVAITVAEPDLQVLAANAPHFDTTVLIITVGVGVGLFLAVAMLRIFFAIPLKWLLLAFYAAIFALAAFSDADFLPLAFDSGGVTTGPMTVPFIMALGVGVASIRSDENAKSDSFGLVALCSVGPVVAVLALGFVYEGSADAVSATVVASYETTVEMSRGYVEAIPDYMLEMVVALAPIFAFFLLFQLFSLHLRRAPFLRIIVGIAYTYVGLVLFLTGVNVGFSSLGYILGGEMTNGWLRWLMVPLSMLMGWFIINAEPAVHVLNRQVEELSAGAISAKSMGLSLSIAIALANGIAMVRVLTGISILWFLIPGYVIALGLAFVVPPTFTAIAFDSGGVASGPLTATFMLPFAMGACSALGGNVMTDAFGLVAMVAMMPLITIQIMGAVYVLKTRGGREAELVSAYGENDIIELWEVA
ncbi:MAG: DUF1538 domain-containing protein [Oscillospiraceae bacterium]|nr:DUF1538 domain-containing protein [Oscillospiraceae bacterium]